MAPLIALVGSWFVFQLAGWMGWAYVDDWAISLRFAVAVMFLLTASAHWGKRRADLIRMVPPGFGNPALLITCTGWLEIAGAIGIVLPVTSGLASAGLILLLLAMFPANVYAAREKLLLDGRPVTPLGARTVLQAVFITAVALAGWMPAS